MIVDDIPVGGCVLVAQIHPRQYFIDFGKGGAACIFILPENLRSLFVALSADPEHGLFRLPLLAVVADLLRRVGVHAGL